MVTLNLFPVFVRFYMTGDFLSAANPRLELITDSTQSTLAHHAISSQAVLMLPTR
jgi:hypothetical protein